MFDMTYAMFENHPLLTGLYSYYKYILRGVFPKLSILSCVFNVRYADHH